MGPHLVGAFETMIKAAKQAVSNILGNATNEDEDEELHTVFRGAESLLNARPLTYQSADIKDIMPLTPNHFFFGQVGGEFDAESVKAKDYHPKKHWRWVQELVRHFWKQWIEEWLPSISTRGKWNKMQRDLKEGDIVLVISPDAPWGKWPLGRVLKVFPGLDGHARVVKVGAKKYTRPISKLSPLKINEVNQYIKEGEYGQKNIKIITRTF